MADDDRHEERPARTSPWSRRRKEERDGGAHERTRLRRLCLGLSVVAVVLAGVAAVLAISRANAVDALQKEREAVAASHGRLIAARSAAEEYATRSLTIDYKRAAEYVEGLRRGTTDEFAKNFSSQQGGAGLLTQELLQQLRMVSEGKVLYAHFDGDLTKQPADGEPWNFVVVATQTATTSQQPEKSTTAVILRVVVVSVDGQWKVANFAPDPKVQGGGGIPGVR